MDTLCENIADPDVSFELFGRTFSAPIFVAPLGAVDMHYGKKYNDLSYNAELIRAAADCGILAFTGDGVSFCPRPRFLSGCVTTPTTSLISASRARHGTAKSGVPIKTVRSRFMIPPFPVEDSSPHR